MHSIDPWEKNTQYHKIQDNRTKSFAILYYRDTAVYANLPTHCSPPVCNRFSKICGRMTFALVRYTYTWYGSYFRVWTIRKRLRLANLWFTVYDKWKCRYWDDMISGRPQSYTYSPTALYNPNPNPDLWPYELKIGSLVTPPWWTFKSIFGVSMPFCFRVRIPHQTDGRRDGRTDRKYP